MTLYGQAKPPETLVFSERVNCKKFQLFTLRANSDTYWSSGGCDWVRETSQRAAAPTGGHHSSEQVLPTLGPSCGTFSRWRRCCENALNMPSLEQSDIWKKKTSLTNTYFLLFLIQHLNDINMSYVTQPPLHLIWWGLCRKNLLWLKINPMCPHTDPDGDEERWACSTRQRQTHFLISLGWITHEPMHFSSLTISQTRRCAEAVSTAHEYKHAVCSGTIKNICLRPTYQYFTPRGSDARTTHIYTASTLQ